MAPFRDSKGRFIKRTKLGLLAHGKKYRKSRAVVVGYTKNYAVYVHENLKARHPVGQAKYLEQPARALAGDIGRLVRNSIKGGATLEEALLVAGLRLQRESQLLVPVKTGDLKGSAFTRLEVDK